MSQHVQSSELESICDSIEKDLRSEMDDIINNIIRLPQKSIVNKLKMLQRTCVSLQRRIFTVAFPNVPYPDAISDKEFDALLDEIDGPIKPKTNHIHPKLHASQSEKSPKARSTPTTPAKTAVASPTAPITQLTPTTGVVPRSTSARTNKKKATKKRNTIDAANSNDLNLFRNQYGVNSPRTKYVTASSYAAMNDNSDGDSASGDESGDWASAFTTNTNNNNNHNNNNNNYNINSNHAKSNSSTLSNTPMRYFTTSNVAPSPARQSQQGKTKQRRSLFARKKKQKQQYDQEQDAFDDDYSTMNCPPTDYQQYRYPVVSQSMYAPARIPMTQESATITMGNMYAMPMHLPMQNQPNVSNVPNVQYYSHNSVKQNIEEMFVAIKQDNVQLFSNLITAVEKSDHVGALLSDITNKTHGHTLVSYACEESNIAILKCLLNNKNFSIDVNSRNKANRTGLSVAVRLNNLNICQILYQSNATLWMDSGFNAKSQNGQYSDFVEGLYNASANGNLEIIQLIIKDFGNQKNIPVGRKKGLSMIEYLSSQSEEGTGYTGLQIASQNGYIDCVEYFLTLARKHINNKSDKALVNQFVNKTGKVNKDTALEAACRNYHSLIAKMLIDNGGIVNCQNKHGFTPIYQAAANGDLETMKVVYKEGGDVLIYSKIGVSPLIIACERGHMKTVKWLINTVKRDKSVDLCNKMIQQSDSKGQNALMIAVNFGFFDIVCYLTENTDIYVNNPLLIVQDKRKATTTKNENAIEIAIRFNQTRILQVLCNNIMKRTKIEDCNAFNMNIFKIEDGIATAKQYQQTEMVQFLETLDKYSKRNDFAMVQSLCDSANNVSSDTSQIQIENKRIQLKQSNHVCQLFLKYCKAHCDNTYSIIMNGLVATITALVNDRQPISDDVLILAWKFASVYKNNGGGNDGDALLNSLKKTVSLCLSRKNECKARDYLYFRTFLAESNIWFEKIPNKMSKLVYDEIEESSINNQLRKQQEFIYQHILQEKKENPKNWQAIVNYQETIISRDKINIRQDSIISKYDSNVDLMAKHGTRPEISQNKLYNNFENNFSGTLEYDLNIYLTKLLINAHSINDKFQEDVKSTFGTIFGLSGIKNGHIASAPVKMRDRCVAKTVSDYSNKQWCRSSQLVDVVRCSVTFETCKDMLTGMEAFKTSIDLENAGCIKQIVRIKNMFKYLQFLDTQKNPSLKDYRYCDIKFNILIDDGSIAIIGEVQFLLSFMLKAKTMGHSLYGYKRRKELIYQVLDIGSNSSDEKESKTDGNEIKRGGFVESRLRSIVSFRDLSRFSNTMLVVNRENIDDLMNFRFNNGYSLLALLFENGWMKALKLYHATVLYFDKIGGNEKNEQVENVFESHGIDHLFDVGNGSKTTAAPSLSSRFVNDMSFWKIVTNYCKQGEVQGKEVNAENEKAKIKFALQLLKSSSLGDVEKSRFEQTLNKKLQSM